MAKRRQQQVEGSWCRKHQQEPKGSGTKARGKRRRCICQCMRSIRAHGRARGGDVLASLSGRKLTMGEEANGVGCDHQRVPEMGDTKTQRER